MTTTIDAKPRLRFEPINVQQAGFVASDAPDLLFSGAFGAGKTIALCTKALKLSMEYPGNFGLLCRKVRATLTHTTIKTFFEICPPDFITDYNKTEGLVKFQNGSSLIFGGLDDPLKLGSLNLGWVGIDEALETNEEDWNMLEGRLRFPDVLHQMFAACNPGAPAHYLHRKFWDEKNNGHEVYQASSFDNPKLPKDYVEQRLKGFSGVYYQRNVLGIWMGMEGMVYASFDEGQVIPRFKIPFNWLIYTGHDFGGANPAAMFYARDPATADFFTWQEYLPGGKSMPKHVESFESMTEGYEVIRRSGGSHQEDEIRQGYKAHGWPILEPKLSNDVAAGVQRVFDMHSLNKIYVFDDLTNYLREKLSYAYQKVDGVTTDNIENRNRFHLMDAERSILSDFAPETVVTSNEIKIHKFR